MKIGRPTAEFNAFLADEFQSVGRFGHPFRYLLSIVTFVVNPAAAKRNLSSCRIKIDGSPMKMLKLPLAALSFFVSAVCHAASFNCTDAKQPIEIAICSHPELSQADEQLAAAYHTLLGKLTPDGATKLKGVQRRFDKLVRSICAQLKPDELPGCVLGRFQTQTALFRSLDIPGIAVTLDGSFTPWLNDDEASMSALWLEIDQPSALAAAMNSEIIALVSGLIPKEQEVGPYELTFVLNALSSS